MTVDIQYFFKKKHHQHMAYESTSQAELEPTTLCMTQFTITQT